MSTVERAGQYPDMSTMRSFLVMSMGVVLAGAANAQCRPCLASKPDNVYSNWFNGSPPVLFAVKAHIPAAGLNVQAVKIFTNSGSGAGPCKVAIWSHDYAKDLPAAELGVGAFRSPSRPSWAGANLNRTVPLRVRCRPGGWSYFGRGCPSRRPLTLRYSGSPNLGGILRVDVTNATANARAGALLFGSNAGRPYPIDLSIIAMPGCFLYHNVVTTASLAFRSGRAQWSAFVPRSPSLCGGSFYNQAAAIDVGQTPLGITASNAGRVTVGGESPFWVVFLTRPNGLASVHSRPGAGRPGVQEYAISSDGGRSWRRGPTVSIWKYQIFCCRI